jgi:hypothetical protein
MNEPKQGAAQRAENWLGLTALVACGIVPVVTVSYLVACHWRAAAQKRCKENLKQIGVALHLYHDRYGSFPPAYLTLPDGKAAHSWRVLLLPFLGHQELYNAYDMAEPWDGPGNRKLAGRMPPIYRCPSSSSRHPDETNYLAVVGGETAWPGGIAVRVQDIRDGTSLTAHVVESHNTGFSWLAPRDLTVAEASCGINTQLDRGISSRHGSGANFLFCNGTTRHVSSDVNLKILRWIMTISSGRPIAGWPVEAAALADFPPEVRADNLKGTDILPHTGGSLQPGRNYVYCATFQIAWDEIRDRVLGDRVQLQGSPPLATQLNQRRFRRSDLADASYLSMAGLVRDGIVREIALAMNRKFPGVFRGLEAPSNASIVSYAYLEKMLPFATAFDRLAEPLVYRGGGRPTPVKSFGVNPFVDTPGRNEMIKEQVTVLDYAGVDDFVIRLETTSDEITLAKVRPQDSLEKTIETVRRRATRPIQAKVRNRLADGEVLVIPLLAFNVRRDYREIIGRPLLNTGYAGRDLVVARQVIRFMLDETGARLQSEVELADTDDFGETSKPRQFIFDKPFLVCLKERTAIDPYFCMWVENAEVLQRVASEHE